MRHDLEREREPVTLVDRQQLLVGHGAECMVGARGSGGPRGDRNGNFKQGVWTRESVDLHRAIRAKVREIRGLASSDQSRETVNVGESV